MAIAGVSTLGVTVGYATQTKGTTTTPSTFKQLNRINSVGGISISTETIDASALEDLVERSVAGRGTTGGTFSITINITDETITEWTTLVSEVYPSSGSQKDCWFEIIVPGMTKAYMVIAEPPQQLPMPEFSQNGLLTGEITLTINEYKGLQTKVALTTA